MTEPDQMSAPPSAGDAQPRSGVARPALHPAWIGLILAAAVVLVYYPAAKCQFVNLDDPLYVSANPHVLKGLTVDGAAWALRTGQGGNWHPLTWFSHMLDAQVFGPGPLGPHVVSVLFHLANTLLLFGLLKRLTGALWRSALVAGLFALHPLHVESVAWISERKDVLSAFFFLLTLWAYARHVEKTEGRHLESAAAGTQHAIGNTPRVFYLLSILFFALGLMSKPMLVTLPFILLLLDYWPLRRISRANSLQLLREKLPFFLLSAVSCIVTFIAQQKGGAVQSLAILPLRSRMENTPVAYARYLGKMIWPAGLATPYPRPDHWPLVQVWLAIALLASLTLGAIWLSRRLRYVGTGWFWFMGMLVPVIGLVQVGEQSMADRYTYLPLIGLFVVVIWGASDICNRWRLPKAVCAGAAGLVLLACAAHSRVQIGHWQDSETLYRHNLAVTEKNWLAAYNLGWYLDEQKRLDEALAYYRMAIEMEPRYPDPLNNIGVALMAKKQYTDAISYFERALKAEPGFFEAHNNIGKALEELGRLDEAIQEYRLVLEKQPDHVSALNNLGNILSRKGQFPDAIQCYEASLRAKPDQATAHYGLAGALARLGRADEAIGHYQQALQRNPASFSAHNDLGLVLARRGNLDEAILHFREAVRCRPDDPELLCNLGRVLASRQKLDEAIPLYLEALRLAPTNANAHAALGVAMAATGKLDDAVAHFQESIRLRPDNANGHFYLGRALAAQGKSDEAIQQFTEALRLRPDYPQARQELQAITAQRPQ